MNTPSLVEGFLNTGDTQQEREVLTPAAEESTKRRFSSSILQAAADRYGLQKAEKPEVLVIPPTEEKAREPFAVPPAIRTAPSLPKAEPVFKDPKQFEQIVAEAADEAKPLSFKQVFKAARAEGREEFEYKGDRFNTREAGESKGQWASFLEGRKLTSPAEQQRETRTRLRAEPFEQRLLETDPEPREAAFTDYMKRLGVKIPEGRNVGAEGISQELGPALDKVAPIFNDLGVTPEITSGLRSRGNWSLHEVGEAIDLRLRTASPGAIRKLEQALPGTPRSVNIHGEKGRMWGDGTYEYIIHGSGDNIHLHIERETEAAKEKLVGHMIASGRAAGIPKKGLSRYPNLLEKYGPQLHKVN
jgi:hypothetical protein